MQMQKQKNNDVMMK